jgi:hypothetical protein
MQLHGCQCSQPQPPKTAIPNTCMAHVPHSADGRLDPKPFSGCRGEDEVPALPRTARDSDTAAWVASGLEERQSEEQAADRTSSEVRICRV